MKKQEKRKQRNLLICIGGLLFLIVFAFAGPELLLRLQDKSRLTGLVSMANAGTDYTVWKEDYETDTVLRLRDLADGIAAGKQYYVSEQDYEVTTEVEIYDLLDQYILNTEWNYIFQDMGMIPEDFFYKNLNRDHITVKRYILYDEKLTDGVAIMAYDICVKQQDPENAGVSIECIVDSETRTLYAIKVVLENETTPVTWDDISADAPYYFIVDYMQSYLRDYESETYIEIEGAAQTEVNTQVVWDDQAKTGVDAGDIFSENTYDLDYGDHQLHLLVTLLNASEGQLEKGVGYLFGIREIAEKIPGFLP